MHGVLVASGPHFKTGVRLDEASVLDVTPTLLRIFGLPTAKDMDGKVLMEALDADFADPRVPAIASYETGIRRSTLVPSGSDELIKEQIRALGYAQ